jgi:hypothetical protein
MTGPAPADIDALQVKALQARALLQQRQLATPPDVPESGTPSPPGMPSKSLLDVGREAITNAWPSAVEFGKNIVHPFLHPQETADGMLGIVNAYAQRAREKSPPHLQGRAPPFDKAPADAFEKHFAERYGGWENIKETMAKDPVGSLADASVALTGAASLPAR